MNEDYFDKGLLISDGCLKLREAGRSTTGNFGAVTINKGTCPILPQSKAALIKNKHLFCELLQLMVFLLKIHEQFVTGDSSPFSFCK